MTFSCGGAELIVCPAVLPGTTGAASVFGGSAEEKKKNSNLQLSKETAPPQPDSRTADQEEPRQHLLIFHFPLDMYTPDDQKIVMNRLHGN